MLAVGIVAQLDAGTVILRALVVMIACWFIGQVVGQVAQRVIEIEVASYKTAHPLPSLEVGPASDNDTGSKDNAPSASGVAPSEAKG